jgi:hypothetical protein
MSIGFRQRRFAVRLLKFDDAFKANFGLVALAPASRLLIYLTANGPVPVKFAVLDTALSYKAFYDMLHFQKRQGMIEILSDPHDGRVRRVTLTAQAVAMIDHLSSASPCLQDSYQAWHTQADQANIVPLHHNSAV